MIYPGIVNYIEAFENLKGRFATLRVKPLCTEQGSPLYRTKGGMAWFATKQGVTVGVFLSERGRAGYSVRVDERLLEREFYVHTSGSQGDYYDVVVRGGESGVVVKPAKEPQAERYFSEGLKPQCVSGRWGFENHVGESVIVAQWDAVEEFSEGRAVVENGGFLGLIDNKGEVIIPVDFDDMSWDGSRYIYAERNGQWGVFNRMGQTVTPLQWDWVGEFSNGYAVVESDTKYGFIDTTGEVVISPKYDDAGSFNQYGSALVKFEDKEFFIDTKERRV